MVRPIAFDGSGYMVTGWYGTGGAWEYYSPSGMQVRGWAQVQGSWYYLDPASGLMRSGWQRIDGAGISLALPAQWQRLGEPGEWLVLQWLLPA